MGRSRSGAAVRRMRQAFVSPNMPRYLGGRPAKIPTRAAAGESPVAPVTPVTPVTPVRPSRREPPTAACGAAPPLPPRAPAPNSSQNLPNGQIF